MTLLYASTFTDALARLSNQEQKQVKLTAFDLQLDPTSKGLQMHRIDKAEGFWSIRVNLDLRIILHKAGERILLAYVDHHDAAYRWAERKRLIPHERTGAMQFVEVPVTPAEGVPAETAQPPAPGASEAGAGHPPFRALSDDQLLDVGVPRAWLETVRETAEQEIDALCEDLPAEAAEALLDFATGGRLEDHIVEPAAPGSDPFAHPDAQRRFRVVEGVEELKAALDAPFEKWAVFLHPLQRASVERAWRGPARISGSAGTGKTIVALHRAVRLAEDEAARVLLTTFSKRLAENMAAKAELLTAAHPDLRARLQVRAIDQAAYELFAAQFGQPNLAKPAQLRAAIAAAQKEGLGGEHSAEFLFEEWEEVVDAWGLQEEKAYAGVPRIGRKLRLGPKQRASAWAVFAFLRDWLAARKLITRADLYGRLTTAVKAGLALPYTHFVVDEAQDLSVAQARFLAAAGGKREEALFFTGDLGQRIFHLPFSWLKLGLDIRGRAQVLKVCYRTSHQIRSAADRLLAPEIADQDGTVESRRGTVSVFEGPEPELVLHNDPEAETAAVGAWLNARLAEGVAPAEMAVIVRAPGQIPRARAAAKQASRDIPLILMHDAKGLEYRACAVMAVDEDVLPDPDRLEAVGDLADLEALQETERHLLYVACTRARDRLLISGVEPGSEFLDDLQAR
ncbi:UvrD-helicase domain-containing protein [Aquibaculum arenosum]|uniref:DNA 3'-5' helicase n=1 Tax=Aquibaculum arenosum TaxID=3032591 RepID=A0ABT5YMD2_9PROT|nr:UvrD-helicase domain-containing protein [Fodinicurvata sp. CAU 1616]MDF2096122.1 UvrD-helicase domain-containing protein [Fodinicurvata sp. CAU 1616]